MKMQSRKAHIFIVLSKAVMLIMIISLGCSQLSLIDQVGSPVDERMLRRGLRLRKDETRLKNGTIVGKYSYNDKEGNPIHVKYYADERGYGVELKSVKVSDSDENPVLNLTEKSMSTEAEILTPIIMYPEPERKPIKHKIHGLANDEDPMESIGNVFRTVVNSNNRIKKDHSKNREYETFVERRLSGVPRKYSNKKIRIYSNENIRDARHINLQKLREKICS